MSNEPKKSVHDWIAEKKPELVEPYSQALSKKELEELITEKQFNDRFRKPKKMH